MFQLTYAEQKEYDILIKTPQWQGKELELNTAIKGASYNGSGKFYMLKNSKKYYVPLRYMRNGLTSLSPDQLESYKAPRR